MFSQPFNTVFTVYLLLNNTYVLYLIPFGRAENMHLICIL